jgi:diadenosine tetraphosphate (Ap4A) HIT family hydrolase
LRIAILGWGSLIWNPSELKKKSEKWCEDGPLLPIEFAKKSSRGRLTLVLYKNAKPVKTLWNICDSEDLEEAICNLARREETTTKNIGYISKDNKERCNAVPSILGTIKSWAEQRQLDAVIWTDLTSKGFKPTKDNVRNHIKSLSASEFEDAKIYVRNAPKQVKTEIRDFLEKEFGWTYDGSQKEKDWSELKKKLEERRIDKLLDSDSCWVVVPHEPAAFGHVVVISWKGYQEQDITDKGLFIDSKHMQKVIRIIHDLAFTMKSSVTSNGETNGKKCEKVYLVSECETKNFPFHFHLIPRFEGEKQGHVFLLEKELEESRWMGKDQNENQRIMDIESILSYYKQILDSGVWKRSKEEQIEYIGDIKNWWNKHPF